MSDSFVIAVFVLMIALTVGCGSADWTEPYPDRLNIRVVDSIGVETGDSCYTLGSVVDVVTAPNGDILILDRAPCKISVFNENGGFIRIISRQGNGPGEFLMPKDLTVLQGGRILVTDMMKYSLIIFEQNGDLIEEINEWLLTPPFAITGTSTESYAGCVFDFVERTTDILIMLKPSVFILESTEPDMVLGVDSIEVRMEDLLSSPAGLIGNVEMASDIDGRVFFTFRSTEEYLVRAWDADGAELFTASIGIPPVEKTAVELEEENEYIRNQLSFMGVNALPPGLAPDPYHQFVTGIGIDSAGNLWVLRGTEVFPVFDIFDTAGNHVATAEFPIKGKFWQFSINPYGSTAWNLDPESGFQKVYMLELPSVNGIESDAGS